MARRLSTLMGALLDRSYGLLLLAYPRAFRRRVGTDMADVFHDLCAHQVTVGGPAGMLRFALRKQPSFSITVVFVLAIGIAGTTGIFSVFNGLFMRPLPFENPDRLVNLDEAAPQWNLEFVAVNFADFASWREQNRTFEAMAVFDETSLNLSLDGEPSRVDATRVSHDIFDVLGVAPVIGRAFTADEDRPGAAGVVLLGHSLWRDRFGADPRILGRALMLDSEPYTVIGVLPAAAEFIAGDLWTPLRTDITLRAGSWWLTGIGRLQAGVTMEQARADLERIHRGMVADREVNEITSPVVIPLLDRILGDLRLGTMALLAGVSVVLLIACANIAGLMLARSTSRSKEVGIRAALGANRRRIVQQLLTESVVLAAGGALVGVALGHLGVRAAMAFAPDSIPRWIRFDMDLRFLVFTVAVTASAALLFGYGISLPAATYEGGAAHYTFFTEHLAEVRGLPGVLEAGATTAAPLGGHNGWFFEAEGAEPRGEHEPNPVTLTRWVTPSYIGAVGVSLLAGRAFTDFDADNDAEPVIIVNQSFAAFHWPDESPIGKRVKGAGMSLTVVGLAQDVRHYGLDEDPRLGVYLPFGSSRGNSSMTVVVRTAVEPLSLTQQVRDLVAARDANLPVYDLTTMSRKIEDSMWARRASSWTFAVFAGVALLLAVSGIYGVVSYAVGRRTQEIGIRMALGAQRTQVLRHVVRQGAVLAGVGAGIGLLGAVVVARGVSSLLAGVSATDPGVYVAVTLLLLAIALLASLIPARRAASIDPMEALRRE